LKNESDYNLYFVIGFIMAIFGMRYTSFIVCFEKDTVSLADYLFSNRDFFINIQSIF